jgi:hypothetical protein
MRAIVRHALRSGNAAGRIRGGAESGALLTSAPFVLAVALLVLNDWMLKATLGNWVTGKLSDFAGLFAFPLLWTALLPRRRDAAFVLTAAGFLFWKSPLSEAPLAAWNALGVWPLARVVDYTDWVALAALLPSYQLARRCTPGTPIRPSGFIRRAGAVVGAAVAFAAFAATSVAPPRYDLQDATGFQISATRSEVRGGLDSLGLLYVVDLPSREIAARRQLPVDTLLIYIRQPPERAVGVRVEVSELAPSDVRIRLLDVSASGPEPRVESIQNAFRKQVFEPLREWVARHRTSKG